VLNESPRKFPLIAQLSASFLQNNFQKELPPRQAPGWITAGCATCRGVAKPGPLEGAVPCRAR